MDYYGFSVNPQTSAPAPVPVTPAPVKDEFDLDAMLGGL